MLKQFFTMIAVLFAVLTITGCAQYEHQNITNAESVVPYHTEDSSQNSDIAHTETANYEVPRIATPRIQSEMVFRSIEDLLSALVAVRNGDVSDRFAAAAKIMDFESLDTIHLIANPLGDYRLIEIMVYDRRVYMFYANIGEDDTEEARINAIRNEETFIFTFTRWTYEDLESWGLSSPMAGVMRQFGLSEEDLIGGRYFFSQDAFSNHLSWAEGSNRLGLTMPRTSRANRDTSGIAAADIGIATEPTVQDMLHFTNTVTLDLQNQANIAAWSAGDFTMVEELLESSR